MAHILGVGIATLDIVNIVDGYPEEDAEVRAVDQRVARGGNCSNSLVVLSQLGHRCAWSGVLADEPDGRRVLDDLARHAIDVSHCRVEPAGKVPTSYVALNQRTGSRTIIHYRDLPELGFEDFVKIDLTSFHWLHFEGRDVEETARMLQWARAEWPELPCSVEVEKPRPGIEGLFGYADLLLFSRAYAQDRGFSDPRAFLREVRLEAPHPRLACAWGAEGAYGIDKGGTEVSAPAFPPPTVVDTLGAGDAFNAGVIDGLLRGLPLATALTEANRLAGKKCGQHGFDKLA
jgi:ketohexokinase